MTRAPVSGTHGFNYDSFTKNIEQPYKTVFNNMIRLKKKTKSASLLSSLAYNEDENVEYAYQVLKKLPLPLHKNYLN